jgi:hypothetical protein
VGGEKEQAWACAHCATCRPQDLHPYTLKLLRLRLLQAGGYPFRRNDLTIEEWMDLGRITDALRPPAI